MAEAGELGTLRPERRSGSGVLDGSDHLLAPLGGVDSRNPHYPAPPACSCPDDLHRRRPFACGGETPLGSRRKRAGPGNQRLPGHRQDSDRTGHRRVGSVCRGRCPGGFPAEQKAKLPACDQGATLGRHQRDLLQSSGQANHSGGKVWCRKLRFTRRILCPRLDARPRFRDSFAAVCGEHLKGNGVHGLLLGGACVGWRIRRPRKVHEAGVLAGTYAFPDSDRREGPRRRHTRHRPKSVPAGVERPDGEQAGTRA